MFKNIHNFARSIEIPNDLHGLDGIVDDAMLEYLSEEPQMEYKKYTLRLAALEDGKKEGMAQGKIEGRAEVARSMLSDRIPIEVISKHTGFTLDEIKQL